MRFRSRLESVFPLKRSTTRKGSTTVGGDDGASDGRGLAMGLSALNLAQAQSAQSLEDEDEDA